MSLVGRSTAARPLTFHRIFIANRGEVVARVARTCEAHGIEPVIAVSEADRDAPYTRGRRTVCLGPARSSDSYLDLMRVVQAAKQSGCTAVHPGWGFLSENPRFAALCESHGLTFIGPPAHVMHLMGKKSPAKRAMAQAGMSVIPGSDGVLADLDALVQLADQIGYPLLVKAESGGGGRGMRIARAREELEEAFSSAAQEAQGAFGDPRVYAEKLIEGGRHVEIQILADRYGNVVHLGERDCTVQRKHQKLIEESPSPSLNDEVRMHTLERAARAAAAIGYVGAGTMEMLLDSDGELRFMEMNTRLQVEHPVTEMRSGVDLVWEQIRVAAGHPLGFSQADIELRGHSIECRINAENPADDFRPSPGTIELWAPPEHSDELRVETHVETGYTVPPHYDSLICKLVARGSTRTEAIERMLSALRAFRCDGIHTTAALHIQVLSSAAFRDNDYDTRAIPGVP